jgi:hypothetical protein
MVRRFGRTAAVMVLSLLPVPVQAQHRAPAVSGVHAQPRAQAPSHRMPGQPPHHHRFDHRPFGHRLFGHRPFGAPFVVSPFFPFGGYSATTVVYSAPPVDYAPPPLVYVAPPYGAAPAYAVPPAPAAAPSLQQDIDPLQREVVFPSGRYVLRGDGITTPYTWVWIPNPPTSPPPGTPSSSRSVERSAYTWTDANGVTTWTDRLSNVPPEYRATARRDF